MRVNYKFDYKEDDFIRMPTEVDFFKYMSRSVNYEADAAKKEYEKIVSKFKSKKSRRVKFLAAKARMGKIKRPAVVHGVGDVNSKALYAAAGTNSIKTPIVWLDSGTRWRARRMTPNWISKTTPNSLAVGRGRGYAMKGKNAWGRFPGIEARNFRDQIVKKRYPIFVQQVISDFARMLRIIGWTPARRI